MSVIKFPEDKFKDEDDLNVELLEVVIKYSSKVSALTVIGALESIKSSLLLIRE